MTRSTTCVLRCALSATIVATSMQLMAGRAAAQSSADDAAVRKVVTDIFDAMAARDTAAMSALMAPGARFARRARDGATVSYTTPAEFFVGVARATGPAWIERTYDTDVRIDGPLASVWAYYTLHIGEEFVQCGYDAFQMMKLGDAWKIVHIADTVRKEDCERTNG
ncbi:MAG: nuclear transport factor 2 family protein [Longimicrobiales bacterium]